VPHGRYSLTWAGPIRTMAPSITQLRMLNFKPTTLCNQPAATK